MLRRGGTHIREISENRGLLDFLRELFGEEWEAHLRALLAPKRPYIRLNPLKAPPEDTLRRLRDLGFSLSPSGFWDLAWRVERAPCELGNTVEHFRGEYYVQSPSSMLPVLALGPWPGARVLDIAAAPGSKTTQLAQMMEGRGLIVANEPDRDRQGALTNNLDRCGALNVVLTGVDGAVFGRETPESFHLAVVDVPCSAMGTLHKNPQVPLWWNWEKTARLLRVQRRLILSAYDALVPGGRLVYSTCTIVPEENEGVVAWLLERRPGARVLPLELPVPSRPGLIAWRGREWPPELAMTRRIYPLDFPDGEGFYLALVEKGG